MGNGFHTYGPEPSRAQARGIGLVHSPRQESARPGRHRRALESVHDTVDDEPEVTVDVEVFRRTVGITIAVTHPTRGVPATGEVELVTPDLEVVLPLVDGCAVLSLTGRQPGGDPIIGRTLWVNYFGDDQTRAVSTSVRLSPSSG